MLIRLAASLLAACTLWAGDHLLIIHKQDDSLGVYDAASGQLEQRIAVGVKPHEFALSPDERLAYVTNYGADSYTGSEAGGNTLTIVDLPARKAIGTVDLGEYHRPHGIERGRSGLYYITTEQPAAVLVFDAKKRKILSAIKLTSKQPHMLVLSADERKAWTADAGSGTVTVVDLRERRQFAQVQVGGVPMGLALTSDEKRLFVATRTNQMVVLVDAVANKVRRSIGCAGAPSRVVLSRDGRRLYASLIESGEVAEFSTSTLLEVNRVKVGQRPEGMLAEHGGTALYVSAQAENHVVKLALPELEVVQTITTPARPDPIYLLRER